MLIDDKKQALTRALAGGLIGAALMLALVWVLDAMPWMSHIWTFRNPAAAWADWAFPPFPLASLCLAFLTGAELGVATLPFAGSGRELVTRSLIHFAVMAATVAVWARLIFLNEPWTVIFWFLIPLVLVYAVVWLGRWVGWYTEVAAIREKLGLAPGPSLFHWKESLPYVGFAVLLCLALPAVLRAFDPIDVPALSMLHAFLLLPVGGFMSGLSLGRRHGFCPLYPVSCGAFTGVFILTGSRVAGGMLLAIAIAAVLAGALAGAARHKMKQKEGEDA